MCPEAYHKMCEAKGLLLEFGRGDDTVGNPHRARISQFELVELILLSRLDRQFPVEQFEPKASQSAVPSPPSEECECCFADALPERTIQCAAGQ